MANILIADDNTVCRTVLSILLTNQGNAVTPANDGREALAHLNRTPFDLVVLDNDMPHASGAEVLKQVRKKSNIPAIIVSGTVSPQLAAEYEALKVAAIFAKPVNPKLLRDKIEQLLHPQVVEAPKVQLSRFEQEFERVRNFSTTLTLLGSAHTAFAGIIQRLIGDAPQAILKLASTGAAGALAAVPSDAVIIIPSAAELSEAAQAALNDYVVKPQARVILCVKSSIEELEDMGFSQTLLMRFGARCLEIPE